MSTAAAAPDAARSQRDTLAGFIESLPDATVIADAGGQIVVANTLAERLLGCAPGRGTRVRVEMPRWSS